MHSRGGGKLSSAILRSTVAAVLLFIFSSSDFVYSQIIYGSAFDFSCSDAFEPIGAQTVSALTPGANGLTLNGKKIIVNGNFTIDENLTLINCKILMGSGATMVTSGNVTFNATNTVFAGCTNPWGGITVSTGAKFRFLNCLFRDANTWAIRLDAGYQPQAGFTNRISNCVFVNDRWGIYGSGQFGEISLSPMIFMGNRFLKEDPALNPTGVPYINMVNGMRLVRCKGVLGGTGASNIFDLPFVSGQNSSVGINLNRCDGLRIANCAFTNIRHPSVNHNAHPYNLTTACGIFATGSNISLVKQTGYKSCTFDNNSVGILTDDSRGLEVKGCQFTDLLGDHQIWAIYSRNNIAPSGISIENNAILYNSPGITCGFYIDRPAIQDETAPDIRIMNNTLNLTGHRFQHSFGINVQAKRTAMNKMLIQDNIVRFSEQTQNSFGIFVNGAAAVTNRGIKILNNEVHYDAEFTILDPNDNGYECWGIAIENANSGESDLASTFIHEINGNFVSAASFTDWNFTGLNGPNPFTSILCGIHLKNTPFCRVSGNTVENAFRDFHFKEINEMSDFNCNYMGHAHTGLSCSGNPSNDMGDQINKGNQWIDDPNYIRAGAAHWMLDGEYGEPSSSFLFRFYVNPEYLFHKPAVILPQDEWFLETDDFPLACGVGGEPPYDPEDPRRYVSGVHANIVHGIYPDGLSSAQRWDLDRELIRFLLDHPSAGADIPVLNTWLNTQTSSTAYQYALAEKGLNELSASALTIENALHATQSAMKNILTQISTLQMNIDSGSPDSAILSLQILQLTDSLILLSEDSDQYYDDIAMIRQVSAAVVQQQIAAALHESGRKDVLMAHLKVCKGDSLSDAQIAALQHLAESCLQDYGQCIFDAVPLLPHPEAARFLGKEDQHEHACERDRDNLGSVLPNIKVYPVPADQFVFFELPADQDQYTTWAIMDIFGRSIQNGKIEQDLINITTTDLPSGSYFFVLKSVIGQTNRSVLFSVQH